MADAFSGAAARSGERGQRLDSWKEIAAYLKRDVTTVRRWEKREGLPVHRHRHDKLGSVFAFTSEIDAWSCARGQPATVLPPPEQLDRSSASVPIAKWRTWAVAGAAFAAVALLARGADVARPQAPAEVPTPMPVAVGPPADGGVSSIAISPDGRQIAFAAARAGEIDRVWVRRLDAVVAEPLAGTDGGSHPFWSPDGRHLGFFADRRLKTIALDTREIDDLADAPMPRGGTWSARGVILFAPDRERPLWQVPATGGVITRATAIDDSYRAGHAWPEFLPDGHRFLYLDYDPRRDRHGIYLGDLDSGDRRRLVPVYSSASYSSNGDLLYVDRDLVAVHLDLDRLTLGPRRALAMHVSVRATEDHKAEFSLSRNGVLALRAPDSSARRVTWLDQRGRPVGTLGEAAGYSSPTIAPDGRSVLLSRFDSDDGPMYPWRLDLATGAGRRLTAGQALEVSPIWSGHGEAIVFGSVRNGVVAMLEAPLLPGLAATELFHLAAGTTPESWTPDDQFLLLSSLRPSTKADVLVWSRSTGALVPWLATAANEVQARFSPDGRFVAFASDELGRFEIYVKAYPAGDRVWRISDAGGVDPRWHPDGRRLFYIRPDRTLVSVALGAAGDAFDRAVAQPLFDIGSDGLWAEARNHYDVAADGRILTLRPITDPRQTPFTLMINWQAASR